MAEQTRLLGALVMIFVSFPAMCADQFKEQTNHDAPADRFEIEAPPLAIARRVAAERKLLAQVGVAPGSGTAKGYFDGLRLWTVDIPAVKVCFFGGSRKTRARIATIALEWKKAAPGVPLDFGDLNDPRLCVPGEFNHIRVGFKAPRGEWSVVGKASIQMLSQAEPSMNLQGFDTKPPAPAKFRQAVLHEFGHALGLAHEHQSRFSECASEFNWPWIYKAYKKQKGWSRERTDRNMRVLFEPQYLATKYDRKSIMNYSFPPKFYKNGKRSVCYTKGNFELSAGDRELVRSLYPESMDARRAVQKYIRQRVLRQIAKAGASQGAKTTVLQLIDQYVPALSRSRSAAEK